MGVFLTPGNMPFLVALGLMLAIGLVELMALLIGLSVFEGVDDFLTTHFEADVDGGVFGHFFGWLYIGKAPTLVIVVLFLLAFSLAGLVGQWLLSVSLGMQLPAAVAAVVAFLTALPFVRAGGRVIAKHMPRDESSAVSEASFIGRTATFVGLPGATGAPAEARLTDEHGKVHYILIEPDDATTAFSRGETVLIVSQISGTRFQGIANPRPDVL